MLNYHLRFNNPSIKHRRCSYAFVTTVSRDLEICRMSKIVLRLLTPSLKEEEFQAFVGDDWLRKANWKCFYASDRPDKNSIGYLCFDKVREAEAAISELNGKQVGKTNYKAVVCMAPYQKVPTRQDAVLTGSIEQDSRYIQFLETMNLKAPLPPAAPELKPRDFKTPLVEYLEGLNRRAPPRKLKGKGKPVK